MDTKHPLYVKGFEGSLGELARSIGNMRYDAIEELLRELAGEIDRQSEGDKARGRHKLSSMLARQAKTLNTSAEEMKEIWELCEKYMK